MDCMLASQATIAGPPGSPFEGGRFHLILKVPENYPLAPPTATFRTTVFHPNVHFKVNGGATAAVRGCTNVAGVGPHGWLTGRLHARLVKFAWIS
eukprot:COSAG01_NODE_1527_length_10015_cov_79.013312_3_plen_95_part_00